MPDFELHETTTLAEASDLMRRYGTDARFLAGGTDLLVDLRSARVRVGHVISLNRIDDLRGISMNEAGLRIGALTTIAQLDRSNVVRERFSPILDATGRMSAPPIRSVATVGGNIVSAVPCADLPPILTTMHASVMLWSPEGERSVPLETLFVGPRQTTLSKGEILLAVHVPFMRSRFGAAYARFGLREGNAIAVASVAASLELNGDDTVRECRIVLGSVAPIPKLVESAGAALIGKKAEADAFRGAAAAAMSAAEPICDVRGSAEFRRELVGVLTQRALKAALQRAQEAKA